MSTISILPNDAQREALCVMMQRAFVEIRALGWSGKPEQAADLADAFHNLPTEVCRRGQWDVRVFRQMLRHYQDKYGAKDSRAGDYVAMLDSIISPTAADE
jgi:hypothetical protein